MKELKMITNNKVIAFDFFTNLFCKNKLYNICKIFKLDNIYLDIIGIDIRKYDLYKIIDEIGICEKIHNISKKHLQDIHILMAIEKLPELSNLIIKFNFDNLLIWNCYVSWDEYLESKVKYPPFFYNKLISSNNECSFYLDCNIQEGNKVEIICDRFDGDQTINEKLLNINKFIKLRYYDPEVGRFINADIPEYLSPDTLNGLNLFAYCNNNPVMNVDFTGNFAISILLGTILIGALIGGAVGGGVEIGRQLIFKGGVSDWEKVGWSVLAGAVAGAITAIPLPGTGLLSYIGTYILGGTGSIVSGLISGSINFDNPLTIAMAFAIGGVANIAGRSISNIILGRRASIIYNQSNKLKSLGVQRLQGHVRNMGKQALKGNMRNAFKNTSLTAIKRLIINANPFIRYGIYASLNSASISAIPYLFMKEVI